MSEGDEPPEDEPGGRGRPVRERRRTLELQDSEWSGDGSAN